MRVGQQALPSVTDGVAARTTATVPVLPTRDTTLTPTLSRKRERGLVVLLALLALTSCGSGPRLAEGTALECVPYARAVSGITLYGDAADWWDQAEGRYPRSHAPRAGAVLVFKRSARLPYGHVSVVARLRGRREIAVSQANWVHHRIGRDEPVVDVSERGDWSAVRVWWAPSNTLGATTYATYGFVGPS